jgi:4-hydroxybenzoate polyprenyltransferase
MRLLDFFFALRPLVLVPAWSFFVLGHALTETTFPFLRFFLFTLCMCGVHLANQVADFETDRLNAKGLFLQRGVFSRRLYTIAAAAMLALALGVAAGTGAGIGTLALVCGLGLAYSLPPLRLSGRPILDLSANALGYGALALWFGTGSADVPVEYTVAGVCAVGAVFVHTTLLDVDGDARTGKVTTGVALGNRRAGVLAALLGTASLMCAVLAEEPMWIAACAFVAIAAWWATLRPLFGSRIVVVGGTAVFALAAGVEQPVFLAAVLLLVVQTRTYYRRRFGLAYPF